MLPCMIFFRLVTISFGSNNDLRLLEHVKHLTCHFYRVHWHRVYQNNMKDFVMRLTIFITLIVLESIHCHPTCPDDSLISGCVCRQTREVGSLPDLLCKEKGVYVDQVIQNLNKHSNGEILKFGKLYWESDVKVPITDNFFGNVTFRKVMIGTPLKFTYVTYLSPKAFVGPIMKELEWFAIRSYEMRNQDHLYKAIRSLPNLKYVAIEGRYLVSVPTRAFQPLCKGSDSKYCLNTHLRRINFTEGLHETFIFLTRIEENAFQGLPNLKEVSMKQHDVHFIADYAFACDKPISKKLKIDLSLQWSREFNTDSFSPKALMGTNRPTELILFGNPHISHLPEVVFGPFFEENDRQNTLKLGQKMSCSCEMYWLYSQPERYKPQFIEWKFTAKKDNKEQHYLVMCQDDTDLWDLEPSTFNNCTSEYPISDDKDEFRDEL